MDGNTILTNLVEQVLVNEKWYILLKKAYDCTVQNGKLIIQLTQNLSKLEFPLCVLQVVKSKQLSLDDKLNKFRYP
jgi:hypothetical protein